MKNDWDELIALIHQYAEARLHAWRTPTRENARTEMSLFADLAMHVMAMRRAYKKQQSDEVET